MGSPMIVGLTENKNILYNKANFKNARLPAEEAGVARLFGG